MKLDQLMFCLLNCQIRPQLVKKRRKQRKIARTKMVRHHGTSDSNLVAIFARGTRGSIRTVAEVEIASVDD